MSNLSICCPSRWFSLSWCNGQVRRFEPAVAAPYGALHSANTGVTDFERICQELLDDIKSTGRGRVLYNFQVKGIEGSAGGAVRVVGKEPGQRGPDKVVESGNAVNCAGLYSDTVAMGSGASQEPRIFPFRGRYLRVRFWATFGIGFGFSLQVLYRFCSCGRKRRG